ncbi:MlaE family lipid ABC transporter permease subunit [Candidatus Poribacteria bacterium]|nr:MlaE family lipid ABC transporter permease subunit [Candidatus Poribacteria bacterium]
MDKQKSLQENFVYTIKDAGKASILFFSTVRMIFKRPYEFAPLLKQLYYVGVKALSVVIVTGAVVGLVSAIQAFYQLKSMSAEGMIGGFVSVSVIKELAPLLTAFVTAARVGTGMAAEIGTMKVTEQIDALRSMAVSPIKHLVVPRFLACAIMLPILVIFADIAGILGGYLMSLYLGISGTFFFQQAEKFVFAGDVIAGLVKGMTFGIIIALVGCHRGLSARGGAEGVGLSTSSAAVNSFLFIIIANFFLNYGIYAILGVS